MSTVKERILGAVTIMSEEDAEKVAPDQEEIWALNAYKSGDEDYQPSCSQEELIKELGL